ncbi:metalloregulator ArsR/SmtB family transcription factor [Kribbella albertanoniae]|uniref:Metalloregulator ArsR/SmtB family transcription factor n=1 Tax=Kribbella albertanoniae TaxID=1266829 RepID=A0A4R4PY49_9ACTN|nr:metalloregulator ArsR/SmtB family transcription factor [Kribbella albertanoniae]TDC27402.1 metalloregulator ArsR/SmtB family transcription factor [Kribbella albertanoniae]
MEQIAAVLGDGARWRLVELLAERPRSVGELAELTGLRQPQTTKHLQALGRVGLVTVFPLGQRRVYALESEPLTALAHRLQQLASTAGSHTGEREVLARYRDAISQETALADRDHWADGRTFSFERVLPASAEVVWRHWVDPDLLASWWAPPSMTVSEGLLEPRAGGRAVLEYRDADGRYRSEGTVHEATPYKRLVFDLAVLGASFSATYDVLLTAAADGTRLRLDLRLDDTTVAAAPSIAGIETGWNQVLDHLARVLQGAQS